MKLPFSDTHLTLVVVKGYGKNPLMLLTNVEEAEDDPLSILEVYLTRWKCDESFRFLKQSYNLTRCKGSELYSFEKYCFLRFWRYSFLLVSFL